mmetsp:Transcript_714/g.1871  ORF Transcript_714/g.1871 Transcript_714/m.1871 type:complete len:203 (+) Transcript_714:1391-1999(+)
MAIWALLAVSDGPERTRQPWLPVLLAPRRHGHELLGGGRVQRHAVVKVALRGTHLDCDSEALEHLVRTDADDMQTDNLLLSADAHQLHRHRHLVLGRGHGVVHRLELGLVHLHVAIAVLLPGLGLSESHSTDRRVREDDRRDSAVLEARLRLAAKQAVRQAAASGNGDGRELVALGGCVADGVHARHARPLVLVHDDLPLGI